MTMSSGSDSAVFVVDAGVLESDAGSGVGSDAGLVDSCRPESLEIDGFATLTSGVARDGGGVVQSSGCS